MNKSKVFGYAVRGFMRLRSQELLAATAAAAVEQALRSTQLAKQCCLSRPRLAQWPAGQRSYDFLAHVSSQYVVTVPIGSKRVEYAAHTPTRRGSQSVSQSWFHFSRSRSPRSLRGANESGRDSSSLEIFDIVQYTLPSNVFELCVTVLHSTHGVGCGILSIFGFHLLFMQILR